MRQVMQNNQTDTRATASRNMSRYTGALSEAALIVLLGVICAAICGVVGAPITYCVIAFLIVAALAAGDLIHNIRKIDAREVEAERILIKEERLQNQHLRVMDMAEREQDTAIKLAEIEAKSSFAQMIAVLQIEAPDLAARIVAASKPPTLPTPQPAKPAQRKVYAMLTNGLQSPLFDYVAMREMLTAQVQFGTVRNVATVDGQGRPFAHDNSQESYLRQIALSMQGTPLVKDGGKYKLLPDYTLDRVLSWLDQQVHDA